ncbi:hypothetical protein B0I08_101133 [Glaciihabitans tibetensis]|uniref:ScyD/ScyE family protein n=1 Tax=Glaciihabitans tibetensis TaxID=1266600 RepID=A0A2T0VIF4_9MICO|nr:ScyD/ScyE family protein [Glaciihabitans tibetensis]PRY70011.1 hypothetical protein B0I08_101133 [Glaciihabitans tibetensis]
MNKPLLSILACGTLVAPALLIATPAVAGGGGGHGGNHGEPPTSVSAGEPVTLADGLLGPLSFGVGDDGTAYVSQNFAGLLTQVNADGTTVELAAGIPGASPELPGEEIGSVSTAEGIVYYSQSAPDLSASVLNSIDAEGTITELADVRGYEDETNPDQVNTYGFVDLPAECNAQIPVDPMGLGPSGVPYTGKVDSHPYATLVAEDGLYVADAGANAILWVDDAGAISTVAVLPPEPAVTVTAEIAAAGGLPACVAGYDYIFEPVPTDVEYGPDGYLYVTTLPGGPEDPSLGGRGSVYRVDPATGESELVATGFAGATGLAVADNGTVFVAELFGGDGTGQISYLAPGSDAPALLLTVASPAAVEVRDDTLWATTSTFVPDDLGAPQPIGALTEIPLTWSSTGGNADGHHGDDWGDGHHGHDNGHHGDKAWGHDDVWWERDS